MRGDLQVSKLAANSSEVAWAQAYSTHNFYCVIRIVRNSENPPEETLASIGKEILEKLQREFFAIDEKDLLSIKEAVKNSLDEIPDTVSLSFVLATTKQNVLYIVTFSEAFVFLVRDEKIGKIASGESEKIHAFSGKLLPQDLVILQTDGFSRACPADVIYPIVTNSEFEAIAEELSPLIHTDSKGDEAAIFLLYTPPTIPHSETQEEDKEVGIEDSQIESDNKEVEIHIAQSNTKKSPLSLFKFLAKVNIPKHLHLLRFLKSKKILPLIIILVIGVFVASLIIERNGRQQEQRQAELNAIIAPISRGIDEVNTLSTLNKTLAVEELEKVQNLLNEHWGTFEEGSEEHAQLLEQQKRIDTLKQGLEEGNPITDQTKIATLSNSTGLVSFAGDEIAAVSGEEVFLYDTEGNEQDSFTLDVESRNVSDVASDEQFIYLLSGNAILSIDKGNGRQSTLVDDAGSAVRIEVFGSNIYALEQDGAITRYRSPQYSGGAYFQTGTGLPISPLDLAIDGSIYVIQESGTIQKFTKGEKDPFDVKGMASSFGPNTLLMTASDFSLIYILDRANARIVAIEKNGNFSRQYEWTELKNASGFTVSTDETQGVVVIGKDVYTFGL